MKTYNGNEVQHGITETYHKNGQLNLKAEYQNGNLLKVIEEYDFNGNRLN